MLDDLLEVIRVDENRKRPFNVLETIDIYIRPSVLYLSRMTHRFHHVVEVIFGT